MRPSLLVGFARPRWDYAECRKKKIQRNKKSETEALFMAFFFGCVIKRNDDAQQSLPMEELPIAVLITVRVKMIMRMMMITTAMILMIMMLVMYVDVC